MDNKNILREFIFKNFLKEDTARTLLDDDSFIDNGIIDSVGVLELVAFIEETYGFRVEDEEIVPENFDSIAKLDMFVRSKLAVKRS